LVLLIRWEVSLVLLIRVGGVLCSGLLIRVGGVSCSGWCVTGRGLAHKGDGGDLCFFEAGWSKYFGGDIWDIEIFWSPPKSEYFPPQDPGRCCLRGGSLGRVLGEYTGGVFLRNCKFTLSGDIMQFYIECILQSDGSRQRSPHQHQHAHPKMMA
jgi:hypothetical protein